MMISKKSLTAFVVSASLVFTACSPAQIKIFTIAATAISSGLGVIVAAQEVQAATLDVEAKRLELQAIQENGESIKVAKYLTDEQLDEIINTGGKIKIKLSNGKEVVLQVAYHKSSNLNSKLESIVKHLDKGKYISSSGRSGRFHGNVTRSWVQEKPNIQDSGVAAKIAWRDGVFSTILFRENSRVRVWVEGKEYGGQWQWDSTGHLSIAMDRGAKYRF
ncbi:MAG: hypothetical protein F6K08_03085 [Okeania sp. SIO1H6]|nr:hypothetical protein [Okeania sp. SIO1H6]